MKRGAAGRLRPPAARGWAPCSRQLPAGRRRLPRPPQRQPSRASGSAPCSAPRVLPSSGAARAWPPPAPRPRGLASSPRGRHSAPGSQAAAAAAAPRGAEGTRRAPRGAGRGRSRPPRAPREDGEVGDGRRGRASGGVRLHPRGGAPLQTLPRSPGPEPTAERPARLGTYQPAWDNAAPGTSAMVLAAQARG